ncbi:MAG: TonB-dependent receptor plug domain-containing protein [Alloprevotella sp.]|nr:TonB-dependent receptor plug domain-containing protein [Alloprevotella sp.]
MYVWKDLFRALVCCTPLAVAAQDVPHEQQLGAAAVVRLRPSEEALSPTPLQRLDTAAFRRRGITQTADALRRMGGVTVRDYGGAGGLKTISVRGLGATHTAVILDGLPVTDVRSGIADLSRFRLEELASIELHTADTSPLLCPVRQLGAACIVLDKAFPGSPQDVGTPRHTSLTGVAHTTIGAFGTYNPALTLSCNTNRQTRIGVSADFYHGDNDYSFLLRNGRDTHRERRSNSRMNDWRTEANILHLLRGEKGRLAGKISYADSHRQLPGPVILYTAGNGEHLTERNAAGQFRYDGKAGAAWQLLAAGKLAWQESLYKDTDGQYPGGQLVQNYRQYEVYTTVGAAWGHGPLATAYAADYAYNALRTNLGTLGSAGRHTLQQSLSLRWRAGRTEATARLLHSAYFNTRVAPESSGRAADAQRLCPSVSLRWTVINRPEEGGAGTVSLRAYYKEHFRAPTFTECYYYHLGSTRLLPERTRQAGAGITWEAHPSAALPFVRLTADGYLNRVREKITSLPYNLFVWRTVNLGRVRAKGFDTCAEIWLRPANRHKVVFAANYSLQCATDYTDRKSRSYGLQLAYLPRHSGAASVAWENPWLNAAASLTAASRQWATHEHAATTAVAGYAEWTFSLYRRIYVGKHLHADLRADLLNAFDRQYEVIRRYPMPGRGWRLSATMIF